MLITKYQNYVDFNPKVTLCDHIEDIQSYIVKLPTPQRAEDIINFGLPFKEQFFRPIVAPKELWDLEKLVKSEKDKTDAFKALEAKPHLGDFVAKLHDTFEEGQWQYIRGVPTYIPGNYLKYCSFNRIMNFLPDFRNCDLEKFYWWNECVVKDPLVYGGQEMTRRQVGKTFIALFLAHEAAVTNQSGTVGVQSKTEDDAKDSFKRGVLLPRKYYPFYLRPNSTTDLDTKGNKVEYDSADYNRIQALDSTISYKSSGAHAYDGSNLKLYVNDECGKNIEEDVSYLLSVIRPLLQKDEQIRGKCLFTSTVEEMTKRGGQNFKNMWKESDRTPYADKSKRQIDDNGQTTSGLVPYFTPSQANFLFGKYGESIINDPLNYQYEYLLEKYKKNKFKDGWAEKQAKKGGLQLINEKIDRQKTEAKKQEEIRKYPRNIAEAFRSSAIGCLYNLTLINERLDYLYKHQSELVTYGILQWVGGIKFGEVEFVPTTKEEARIWIKLLPQQYANASSEGYRGRMPANSHLFTAGCDCFLHDVVKDVGKSSKGAGHVYAGFNENFDKPESDPSTWKTDDFVAEYYYRHEGMLTEEFAEDMLMMCIFYGCKMSPESNLKVVQKCFHEWGFDNYLMFPEELKIKDGVPVNVVSNVAGSYTGGDASRGPMVNAIRKYVSEKIGRCAFSRTLEQYRDMDYSDFSPWDLFVSSSKCYQYHNEIAFKATKQTTEVFDIYDFMPRFG